MIRIYFLTIYLLLGYLMVNAQAPCSDFNDPSNPPGLWTPAPFPNGNVGVSAGTPNALDGSQYIILDDDSGGSWYINPSDFKNLGQRFLGQCLYFDFYLEKDGGYGAPIHPTIYIMSGNQYITFVANVTVTPGSGWVRVRAPIANSTGTALPSNSDGTWTLGSAITTTDFNNIMNNSTAVMISPDYTSNPSERVWYDNICVKSCDGCTADFKLDTSFSTVTNAATANLTLMNPVLVSTPNNPGSTYTVAWGDGTSSPYITSTLSHTYMTPGTYTICVTEKKDKMIMCTRCFTFCYSKRDTIPAKDDGATALKSPLSYLESIAKAELQADKQKGINMVPNPAKSHVDLQTNLPKRELVSVTLMDLSGKVMIEKSEILNSGPQTLTLNTEKLVQGVYIVEVKSEHIKSSQKLLISK